MPDPPAGREVNSSNENRGGNCIKPPGYLELSDSNMSSKWKNWLQRYEWYSVAMELDKKSPAQQVAQFMLAIGPDTTEIFNSFALTNEEKNEVSIIKSKFAAIFDPKISVTFERFSFNKITQLEGEPFDDFFNKIKNQAQNCEFGILRDDLLRDKIIIGLSSDVVREKLLSECNLTLDQAIKICRASEIATKQLKRIHKEHEINVIHQGSSKKCHESDECSLAFK